ncbi:MAG TPA: hypothetical protein VF100_07635, partial [Thermoanaerobaculia bacterium]
MRLSTGRTRTTWRHAGALAAAAVLLVALAAGPALALDPPAGDSELAAKAMRDPALYVSSDYDRADLLGGALGLSRVGDLAALGLAADRGFVDRRTGSWGTLLPSVPLVPGAGKGNSLTWAALGLAAPATGGQLEEVTWRAFEAWLAAHAAALRVPAAELGPRTLTATSGGQIVQLNVQQAVAGVPVRGAFLSAVVNHGNLVLMG